MDHCEQVRLLSELLAMLDARTTSLAGESRLQSTHVYIDADHAAREGEVLFGGKGLIAGLSGDVPHAGDYFTLDVGRSSAIVVRGEDGVIRAFLNACRHRGARVAEGRGCAGRVFRCPYHAWVYDLDGKLRGQPAAHGGFVGLDDTKMGLIELPSLEACGFILVGPTPGTELGTAQDVFPGLSDELRSYDFDTWTFIGDRAARWSMNWKLPFETFLESYHIFALHRESLAKEVLATPMLSTFAGPHGRGVLTGREVPQLRQVDQEQWALKSYANLVYWLFPNAVLSLPMTGHAELWQFQPGSTPDECTVTTRFYVRDAPTTEKARSFWERMMDFTMGVVEAEDFTQQEAIQRNVTSGAFPQRIFGRNEPALIHFHESLDQALDTCTAMSQLAR